MQLLVARCYRWQGRENRDLGLKKKRPCWISYPFTASYCSTKVGAASSRAVSSDTAFSAAFFFFFAAFGLAEVFSSFRISASSREWSDLYSASSKGKPVILWGPLGISNTVNLY